ncbi:restriction endonuclease subunit S [Alloprevotella tannerae]|uniref:restriction endonuclease subunit S n=1 Tax=Alloprevotella tannerae TaxID=76122 RepID=UPI003F693ACA|nr:restriction endonuclease subunit S [Alloprevotella tannerae]
MPFEVPKGWVWTTLEEITSKIGSGSTPKGSNYSEEGIPFFRSQNVYNEGLVYEDIKFISDATHQLMIGTEVHSKDLLLNITGGSLGRCAIVPADFQIGNVSQHVCIIRSILVLSSYVHTFILSPFFKKTMNITGSGREGLPKYNLEKMFLPIPPLKEQERIIKEIEHWFTFIDTIEQSKVNLQTAIKQTKNKILDLAIHGKLVPQDPNDEPASELLKRINPKAQITCDNEHYPQLPKGWSITSMQEVCGLFDGERQEDRLLTNLDAKFLRGFSDGKVIKAGRYVPANTYMILVDGENSGEVFQTSTEGYQGSTFKQLNINENMNEKFVLHIINLHRKSLRENKVGSAIPHLNKKLFKAIPVPIPPYAEQERIINAINAAYALLTVIEENL